MGTDIRPEISKRNRYWISRHRYYELKHFCLQYPDWVREKRKLESEISGDIFIGNYRGRVQTSDVRDRTAEIGVKLAELDRNIDLVKRLCREADVVLAEFIFLAVTEGRSYSSLSSVYRIPCGQDMYYDRYHKFFWLLDKER